MRTRLNLENPTTFNEKLQWLKLYDRNPLYTRLVDKAEVKSYVSNKIGNDYIIPTLAVWDSADQIDFESLPDRFVLKCTHDSGTGMCICKDKNKLDRMKVIDGLREGLKNDYFLHNREWPYKNVRHRIIAEQYMEDAESNELIDYKIHNFNGEPKLILVCKDRFKESGLTEDFYSEKWEHLDIRRPEIPNAKEQMPEPAELSELLRLARILSTGIPFVRTDFYIINHEIYFGELTFFPASGMEPYVPKEWDSIIGGWLNLPKSWQVD